MKLNGQDKTFELWVVDYQFRDNKEDEYDSNWLTIGIRLKGFKREWISSDPSLLTWELKSLTDWLQKIFAGDFGEREIEFLEPNLRFELVDNTRDSYKIRTHLTLESRPVWFTDDETFSFDIEVDLGQLEHSIQRLKNELIEFPGRAGVKVN